MGWTGVAAGRIAPAGTTIGGAERTPLVGERIRDMVTGGSAGHRALKFSMDDLTDTAVAGGIGVGAAGAIGSVAEGLLTDRGPSDPGVTGSLPGLGGTASDEFASPEVAALRTQLGIPPGKMSEESLRKLEQHVDQGQAAEWRDPMWAWRVRALAMRGTWPGLPVLEGTEGSPPAYDEATLRKVWKRYWRGGDIRGWADEK